MVKRLIPAVLFLFLPPNLSLAGQICTTKSGHLASADKEVVELAVKYATKHDKASFENLINSRQAFALNGGLRVKVVKRSMGLVCFTALGYEAYNWTQSNALSCP